MAEFGEGEVGGEPSSGEPDRLAFLVGVVWKRDRVTGDLSRTAGALTGLDQHSSIFEGGEEVVLGFGSRGCGGYVPAKGGARRLRPVLTMGKFCLGSGRSRCGCAVGGGGSGEAVTFLGGVAGVGDLVIVAVDVRVASVLAGQDDSEVDVVVGVPYCDPAACLVVTSGGESGLVHHLFGDVSPFIVRQGSVLWGRSDRALPDRQRQGCVPECVEWGCQDTDQVAEVPIASRIEARFQGHGESETRDDVRINVLVAPARAVEVGQQPCDALAAGDFADQRRSRPISTDEASTLRRTFSRYDNAAGSSPGTCPVAFAMRAS